MKKIKIDELDNELLQKTLKKYVAIQQEIKVLEAQKGILYEKLKLEFRKMGNNAPKMIDYDEFDIIYNSGQIKTQLDTKKLVETLGKDVLQPFYKTIKTTNSLTIKRKKD